MLRRTVALLVWWLPIATLAYVTVRTHWHSAVPAKLLVLAASKAPATPVAGTANPEINKWSPVARKPKKPYTHPLVREVLAAEKEVQARASDRLEKMIFHVYKRRRHRWRLPRPTWWRFAHQHNAFDPVQPILERKLEEFKHKFGPTPDFDSKFLTIEQAAPRWPNHYLAHFRQLPEGHDRRQKVLWYHAQWHQRHRLDPLAHAAARWEWRLSGFESFDTEAHFSFFGGFTFEDVKRAFETAPLTTEKIMTQPDFYKLEEHNDDTLRHEPLKVVAFFALLNDTDAVSARLQRQHMRYHRQRKQIVAYYDLYDIPSIEYEEMGLLNDTDRYFVNYTIPHRRELEDELIKKYWAVCDIQDWVAVRTKPPEVVVDENTDPALLVPPKRRGMLILFNADTHEKATQYMANDPLMKHGMYSQESMQIGDADELALDQISIVKDKPLERFVNPKQKRTSKPEDILLNQLPPLDSIPFHHDMNMAAARRYLTFMKRADFIKQHLHIAYLFKQATYRKHPKMPPAADPIPSRILDFTSDQDTVDRIVKRLALNNVRPIPKKELPSHTWEEPIVD